MDKRLPGPAKLPETTQDEETKVKEQNSGCKSPLPLKGECPVELAINKVTDMLASVSSSLSPWLTTIKFILKEIASSSIPTGCFGTFSGSDILNGKKMTHTSGDDPGPLCMEIPVKRGGEYAVAALSIPSALLTGVCPGFGENFASKSKSSFCLVYSTCASSQPLLGIAINSDLAKCFVDSNQNAAASSGYNKLVAQAVDNGFQKAAAAISVSADLVKEVKVFDGDFVRTISVSGNFYQMTELCFAVSGCAGSSDPTIQSAVKASFLAQQVYSQLSVADRWF